MTCLRQQQEGKMPERTDSVQIPQLLLWSLDTYNRIPTLRKNASLKPDGDKDVLELIQLPCFF